MGEDKIMTSKLSILGFAGSLRQGSYNKAILRAALEVVPPDARLEIFDRAGNPPFQPGHGKSAGRKAERV